MHVDRFIDYTFSGGNMDWIMRLTIFIGSPSGLCEKPFMMSKGAVYKVVEKILEFFFVSWTNLTTSRARV